MKKKKIKAFYKQNTPVDLNLIPPITKKVRDLHKTSMFAEAIQATRGCPVGCNFCTISNRKYGRIYRTRDINNVIEEIKLIPQKLLSFSDSSLTINPDYSKKLFREMKGLNKKFICEGNANVLEKDEEFLKLASEAGCVSWFIGFESVNQETINHISKTTNKVKKYPQIIKKIHDYNMSVIGAFMFGFDTDTKSVFEDTLNKINSWDLDTADFSILTPFPGTPIFEQYKKEKRILTRDWAKYTTSRVVFQPKHMTPEELLNGFRYVWKEFYSITNIIKRPVKSIKLGLYPFFSTLTKNYFYFKWINSYKKNN